MSAKSYSYDTAGRLTTAQVSRTTSGAGTVAHSYSYGYGAADPSCTGVGGSVANAGMNGNRTTAGDSVGGTTTSQVFCYDTADRLLKATGGPWGAGAAATYDTRGNTTALGGQSYTWDAADRSTTASAGPTAVAWGRDAADRILSRTTGAATSLYSYTGDGDSPDLVLAGGQAALQLGLPGGALARLTSTGTGSRLLSLTDLHGDTILAIDAAGTPLSNPAVYDPDGQPLSPTTRAGRHRRGARQQLRQHRPLLRRPMGEALRARRRPGTDPDGRPPLPPRPRTVPVHRPGGRRHQQRLHLPRRPHQRLRPHR